MPDTDVIWPTDTAACCGLTALQSESDGFGLVRVGLVLVCGACLVEAGVVEDLAD